MQPIACRGKYEATDAVSGKLAENASISDKNMSTWYSESNQVVVVPSSMAVGAVLFFTELFYAFDSSCSLYLHSALRSSSAVEQQSPFLVIVLARLNGKLKFYYATFIVWYVE